jgi:crotonobetainyl-CoA:carnitine CoA-transferase CaiB-like acyl-CoA transferase
MYDALEGIKVVEVTQFAFVPAAGAVLADWGADVIKIVHPEYGDVMYTMTAGSLIPLEDGTAFMWELVNRGKRSIGLDIATPSGKEVLFELARGADVFLTNFLTPARKRLGIDVDDIRAVNPTIIYGRGSGQGVKGPEADSGGFDAVTFWCRSGWAYPVAKAAGKFIAQPGPGSGDVPSGFALASGIAAALVKRARTGEGSVVDVSLLHNGMFGMSSIVASGIYDIDYVPIRSHDDPMNGGFITGYETSDGRYIFFSGLRHDVGWKDICERLGHPDLAEDKRFSTHELRSQNNRALVEILDGLFRAHPLEYWKEALQGADIPWSVVQSAKEVLSDPQAVENGYLAEVTRASGRKVRLVSSPVQFDERSLDISRPAPEPGQQTEEILLEMGKSWEEISRLKEQKAVM